VLIVAALGGNALLRRDEKPDADIQEEHIARAVDALVPLTLEHDLVITHGNGPQVGQLALESARDPDLSHPYPFDALVAQTQGMIGYWLLQALQNAIPGRSVVSLVTQTLVERDDPAFAAPTKFVGPDYPEDEAKRLAKQWGWSIHQDGGAWRRVVASPEPRKLVEADQVRKLVVDGAVVVCAGGGGVPVVQNSEGRLQGVEAVVDKDLSSSLLARQLNADALLLLTDVPAVKVDDGTSDAHSLGVVSPELLRRYHFPAGSMGPKVEAACRFVEATRRTAAIGRLEDAAQLFAGTTGTVVTTGGPVQSSAPATVGRHTPELTASDKEERDDEHEFAVVPPDRGGR
jgi:carbamate kinase